ncbi:nuclear transport factor 2 family protein [Stenotrophomonas rhizophila]
MSRSAAAEMLPACTTATNICTAFKSTISPLIYGRFDLKYEDSISFLKPASCSTPPIPGEPTGASHVYCSSSQVLRTALNGNDTDTILLSLYSAEPVFMPQNAPALEGREAVRAGYEVFATIKLNVTFDIHEVVQVGEWAWVRTSSAGRTRIPPASRLLRATTLFVFAWRLARKIHRYLAATNHALLRNPS